MSQVRVLTLCLGEHKERVLYRLQKEWVLRFVLTPSLMGRSVRLFTNHPVAADQQLKGNEFREVEWTTSSKHKHDDLDRFADIHCCQSGPFSYFFLCGQDTAESPSGSGYFQIAPTLTVGSENHQLPLDCIQCQTVLTKLLGPFPEWEDRLRVSKESGYNMVHLPPLQKLGISNSSYCINDHLTLNPAFNVQGGKTHTFEDVKGLVQKMRNDWKMLSITDVVWNHMSYDSPVLKEHPECAFNLQNSPHLRPAFVLDRVLHRLSKQIGANKWAGKGLPAQIENEDHLRALKHILQEDALPPVKLHEFFQVHMEHLSSQFGRELEAIGEPCTEEINSDMQLTIVQDAEYKRFGSSVNMPLALILFNRRNGNESEVDRRQRCMSEFRRKLTELNNQAANVCWDHLVNAVNAVLGAVRYDRVADHGPKIREFSSRHSLVPRYFVVPFADEDLQHEEAWMYNSQKNAHLMACNGWVMQDDPLRNFAEPPSTVYFRRELVCWGDNVKLRYGREPKDCPFLWEYMQKYTELSVDVFHGLRIDNCHSTPINVAEYLLAAARRKRPDLYVVAELFTGSEDIDNIFVNRLGLASLVREAQAAGDAHEEGRLVYKYGGDPVGAFVQSAIKPLAPCIAHAILMDMTHDNRSPVESRTVFDLWPSAALVNMACCATGSNRGYDELVPFHIHVVDETALYSSWVDNDHVEYGKVNARSGIIFGKAIAHHLHEMLGASGFTEVFVDQVTPDVVAVTRHNPESHQSVILVARTAFKADSQRMQYIPPLHVPGVVDEIMFEARLVQKAKSPRHSPKMKSKANPLSEKRMFIEGLKDYTLELREHFNVVSSDMVEMNQTSDGLHEVEFTNFQAGSVIAFKVNMRQHSRAAARNLRTALTQFGYRIRSLSGAKLKMEKLSSGTDLASIVGRMSLQDMNRALFRCDEEERDDNGGNAYDIPNFDRLVYCGLQGFVNYLQPIRLKNDLGHPFCANLRQGNWMAEYIARRLQADKGTAELGHWFQEVFQHLYAMPHYLKPSYFDAIVSGAYEVLKKASIEKMSTFVQEGSTFVQALAATSMIFCGYSRNAALPPLSQSISAPHPATGVEESSGKREQHCTTISAGLPHFACGIFRNWGRDTFISMPGMLLLTGRFDEARYIILAFAGTLRHGLIPNLLGSGTHARYNCRDAVWFWLYCIKVYCELAPKGEALLQETVLRLYPFDDAIAGQNDKEQALLETIQEALQRHFEGISFRERDAGHKIDEHMTDPGFNVTAGVREDTGFVYGGNEWNCGTWMDKMGSSHNAGTKGKPATPRDGCAVELTGLCYCVVRWLDTLHKKGAYPYADVKRGAKDQKVGWTWSQWADKIKKNFETYFWIPADMNEQLHSSSDPAMINHRGIYKDLVGATQKWTDYQFRPNFCITLALAPDLCTPQRAWTALKKAEEILLGPLGMKTLDPSDWWYNPYYDNADDSGDPKRAKGFNYHQGPEWVWPVGYFLRAKLVIAKRLQKENEMAETLAFVRQTMSRHLAHMQQSPWKALPELTNKDGAVCRDSCPAQAWSSACLLEVLHELNNL